MANRRFVIVPDGTHDLGEVTKAGERQGPQMLLLRLEHSLELPPGAALNSLGGPGRFPVHQEFVLRFERFKASAGERPPWVCWIAFSTVPFRFGSRTRVGSVTTAEYSSMAP
ncbi:MAG: hypothetical protein QOF74_9381 [Caballeronia mineralivorans]|jgi:hypothetical protein|nr:hypothetical protein [Caballeronia mineralivorans]